MDSHITGDQSGPKPAYTELMGHLDLGECLEIDSIYVIYLVKFHGVRDYFSKNYFSHKWFQYLLPYSDRAFMYRNLVQTRNSMSQFNRIRSVFTV